MTTIAERRAFDEYCEGLMDLIDRDAITDARAYDGVVARSGSKCAQCPLPVPAGIPFALKGTRRAVCPSCVLLGAMHLTLRAEISEGAPDLTPEERASLLRSCIAPPRVSARPRELGAIMQRGAARAPGRLDETITRLHAELRDAPDDDRTRILRLIEAAEKARDTREGART